MQSTVLEQADFLLCVAKLVLAVLEQLTATLIRRDRLFESEIPTFHFLDDLLEFGKCRLEVRYRWGFGSGWRCAASNPVVGV